MKASFAPSYAPTMAQDTLSSVQKQAQKNGYCDVDGHHDIKIRINLGFGKKSYQECHRCKSIHEISLKKLQNEIESSVEVDKESKRQAIKDFEELHRKYETEKQLRIEAELRAEEANERETEHKNALAIEKQKNEEKKSKIHRQNLQSMKTISNKINVQIKMLLIGDSGVGKSWLRKRYACDVFDTLQIYPPTIGVDYSPKFIQDFDDKCKLKLKILDNAGQERYRSMTVSYFRSSHVIILCADVTHMDTFDSIKRWLNLIEEHGGKDVPIILVGNKCDSDIRVWGAEDIKKLNLSPDIQYFEVSALENINVDEMFLCAARLAFEQIDADSCKNTVNLQQTKPNKISGCC